MKRERTSKLDKEIIFKVILPIDSDNKDNKREPLAQKEGGLNGK